MTRKRYWVRGVATVALIALTAACGSSSSSKTGDGSSTTKAADAKVYKVGINRYGTFDVLTQAFDGIKSEMTALGYTEGKNITYEVKNPEFDAAANQTIAQQFIDDKVDVMVGFATPPSQAMLTASKDIPIVFVASSTPVESKLVASAEQPGGNVTGVADILPIEDEIDLMLKVLPTMKRVGLIWNSGDAGGENLYKRAKAHLEEKNLTAVDAPITGTADTLQSAQSLVDRVDAIELPCDSQTLAGIKAIIKTANDAKIPVFGCTGDAVKDGAILAGAFDYTEVGKEAARLIDKILKGAKPADLPVVIPQVVGTYLNTTQAAKLGLTVPDDIKSAAVKTY